MLDAKLECFFFPFLCSQETCQAAGPIQGHGERSPEGGAVGKENAEEKGKSLKILLVSVMDLMQSVCAAFFPPQTS